MTTELEAAAREIMIAAHEHQKNYQCREPDGIMVPLNVLSYVIDHLDWSWRSLGIDSAKTIAENLCTIRDAQTKGATL